MSETADVIAADILRGVHDPRFVSREIAVLAKAYETLRARLAEVEGERDRTNAVLRLERLARRDSKESERLAGAEANVDAIESLNEAHPDYGLTQRLIEAVEQGTRTDEIREQAAILAELTRLRTALAAAERAGAEAALSLLCPWAGALHRETWMADKMATLFPEATDAR